MGEHAMSSSMVRRWVRLFNEGYKNVCDDLWNGRLSMVNEVFVRAFEEKFRDNTIHHYMNFAAFS